MPVSCLHGVELPDPRRKKWSKPVSVSYKTDEGTQKELVSDILDNYIIINYYYWSLLLMILLLLLLFFTAVKPVCVLDIRLEPITWDIQHLSQYSNRAENCTLSISLFSLSNLLIYSFSLVTAPSAPSTIGITLLLLLLLFLLFFIIIVIIVSST